MKSDSGARADVGGGDSRARCAHTGFADGHTLNPQPCTT